ncbi:double zinc ribbon domain-containing protein [Alphaproteobacteria bacterium]|nr:double zinc ribbon domain-containing protein [Alphaproteobacteria bacterium]
MPTKTTIQFRQHYNALLDLLLPKQCPLCRRFCFDHGLCADCWQGLVFITPPFCQCCGRPLAYAIGDHLCGSCFAKMERTFIDPGSIASGNHASGLWAKRPFE